MNHVPADTMEILVCFIFKVVSDKVKLAPIGIDL